MGALNTIFEWTPGNGVIFYYLMMTYLAIMHEFLFYVNFNPCYCTCAHLPCLFCLALSLMKNFLKKRIVFLYHKDDDDA